MERFHHPYVSVDDPASRSSINVDAAVESQEGVGVNCCSRLPAGRGSVRLVRWALYTGGLLFTLLLATSAVRLFSRSSTSLRTDQPIAFEMEGQGHRVSRKTCTYRSMHAVVTFTPVALESL